MWADAESSAASLTCNRDIRRRTCSPVLHPRTERSGSTRLQRERWPPAETRIRRRYGEAHPDQEVSVVEWIAAPGERTVSDESVDVARASPRRRAGRGDAPEPPRFTHHHESDTDHPELRRHRARRHQGNAEEEDRQPAALPEQYSASPGRRRTFR